MVCIRNVADLGFLYLLDLVNHDLTILEQIYKLKTCTACAFRNRW